MTASPIFEIAIVKDDGVYMVHVLSAFGVDELPPPAPFVLPFTAEQVPQKCEEVVRLVEGARKKRSKNSEELKQTRILGEILSRALFPDSIMECFRQSRRKAKPVSPLQLRLFVDKEYDLLPWELLSDPTNKDDFLALSQGVIFARVSKKPLEDYVQNNEGKMRLLISKSINDPKNVLSVITSETGENNPLNDRKTLSKISAFILMRFSLSREDADSFLKNLYDDLSRKTPIMTSLRDARRVLENRSRYSIDWISPILYLDLHNPDNVETTVYESLILPEEVNSISEDLFENKPLISSRKEIAFDQEYSDIAKLLTNNNFSEAKVLLDSSRVYLEISRVNVLEKFILLMRQMSQIELKIFEEDWRQAEALISRSSTLIDSFDIQAVENLDLQLLARSYSEKLGTQKVYVEQKIDLQHLYKEVSVYRREGLWEMMPEKLKKIELQDADYPGLSDLQLLYDVHTAYYRQAERKYNKKIWNLAIKYLESLVKVIQDDVLAENTLISYLEAVISEGDEDTVYKTKMSALIENASITQSSRLRAAKLASKFGDARPGVLTVQPSWSSLFTEGEYMILGKNTLMHLHGFSISNYTTTVAQYRRFIDEGDGYQKDDWWTTEGLIWRKNNLITNPYSWFDTNSDSENLPIVGVSWHEAQAYCNWLTIRGKKEEWIKPDEQIRLPSDAEWEVAACWDIIHKKQFLMPDNQGIILQNVEEAGLRQQSPVGMFPLGRSPSGAFDMGGNVWEWCSDKDSNNSRSIVLRGGSWAIPNREAGWAGRRSDDPTVRTRDIGFRVCLATVDHIVRKELYHQNVGNNTVQRLQLTSEILLELKKVLKKCDEFSTDHSLKTVFLIEELKPWRHKIPECRTTDERVARLIDYLYEQTSFGKPVFPVFLRELCRNYEEPDDRKLALLLLIERLSQI